MGYDLAEIQGRHPSIVVEPHDAASHDHKLFWAKLGRGEYDALGRKLHSNRVGPPSAAMRQPLIKIGLAGRARRHR